MKKLIALSFLLFISPAFSKERPKVKIFIEGISCDDRFYSERFKMLFMEMLSYLKQVETVDSKDQADYVLSGIVKMTRSGYQAESSAVVIGRIAGESSEAAGGLHYAALSVRLNDKSGKTAYVGNSSATDVKGLGATEHAVVIVYLNMKKRMKWK